MGINLFDKISHKRFAWLSFSWMLPLRSISEGVKKERVSDIMQSELTQTIEVSSDVVVLMCWKRREETNAALTVAGC